MPPSHDIETALRLERLEISMEQLIEETRKNSKRNEELLKAWDSALWLGSSIKALALCVIACAGAWALFTKWWEHVK